MTKSGEKSKKAKIICAVSGILALLMLVVFTLLLIFDLTASVKRDSIGIIGGADGAGTFLTERIAALGVMPLIISATLFLIFAAFFVISLGRCVKDK